MARVTHVKKAQQRYAVKPVLNEDGTQKQVPVVNARTGEQKTTKAGRPVFLKVTVRDLERPLPMPTCGYCKGEISVGTPYKWIEPQGRGFMARHNGCPTWNVWEYSSSLSARVAEIQATNTPESLEDPSDATSWAEGVAEQIRELAEEKRESASNMEEGFGHETEQSAELNQIADDLDGWADEVEGTDIPDLPEPEEEDCEDCGGTGHEDQSDEAEVDEEISCEACGGTGQTTPDEPTEDQMDEWREAVRDALQSVLDECPV